MTFRTICFYDSSNIKKVGYHPEKRVLRIEFSSGQTYEYADVPPEIPQGLLVSESPGSYFSTHVRPHFKTVKMSAPNGMDPAAPIEVLEAS